MDDAAEELRTRLAERYAEPHRYYHDVRHLQEVLRTVDALADEADDVEAVRWAAWFHDAVYDVRRDDNEERSAQLAERELTALGHDPGRVTEVARLVRLTATHNAQPGDANGAVLCDADLWILATDAARHAEYVADVRREYAHVPDDQFRAGRAAVLRALLGLDRLYRTEAAHARWEQPARANLSAELDRLAAP
ncbi:MAG TPA: metal-dependent phosphohydrolase [Nocardioidaceae bacterium]|nr:metal-dependent phosphohydrolase [Nocardioidaceae bacterium]